MNTHKISKALTAILLSAIFASLYPAEFIPAIDAASSSWSPTLLVNTESFQRIDRGDASTTVDLEFGASTSTLKLLTNGTFQFNKSLSVVGMLSGSRLTVDGNANISGSLVVKNNITARGTISGTTLNANSLLTGSTLQGFGLFNCQGTSNKLTYNATTKKFLCEADETGGAGGNWSNTGSLQGAFDTRYVNTRGDTMTGNLVIRSISGANAMNLNVIGGISGAFLRVSGNAAIHGPLSVSGAIRTESSVSGAYLTFMGATSSYILGNLGIGKSGTINTKLEVLGTISGARLALYNTAITATGALYVEQRAAATGAMIRNMHSESRPVLALDGRGLSGTAAHIIFGYKGTYDTKLFRSGINTLRTDGAFVARTTVSGANLTFMGATSSYILGNLGIGKSGTINTKLEVVGTISGTTLNANSLLTGSTLQGFGLYNCQGTANKLTYNASTKKFLCEADQSGGTGGSNWSNTGSLQGAFDTRYVNTRGDTMTGNLVIRSISGANAMNLNVIGGISGAFLRASGNADINGVLALSGVTMRQTVSDPSAPAANRLATYAADLGGRAVLKGRGAVNGAYAYQPALFQNFVMMLQVGGGTTINGIGTTVTNDTTISHPAVTETFGYMANFATSTTTNDTAGTSSVNTTFIRGSTAGANGFFYRARIGVVDTTSIRVFSGLANQTIATMVGNDNPAGHHVGFQFSTNRADANWQFTTKDNTTQSVANTTIAFTANKVYDLTFFCSTQCTSITWRIDNVTDGTSATGTASSNLPGTTASLRIVQGVSTLTTAIKNLRMQFAYTESDR